MIAFYALFNAILFGVMAAVGLHGGNRYNQVSCVLISLAFWSSCVFVAAVA